MKHLIQKNAIAPDKKRLINETIIQRYFPSKIIGLTKNFHS